MWAAVRRHTAAGERVANNPLFLSDMTPWPVNISWALLADRRSCYAGSELAIPFAPISAARRAEIETQFVRVFAGEPAAGDIRQLAERYRCDVAVVTAQDGAWSRDPFASTTDYGWWRNGQAPGESIGGRRQHGSKRGPLVVLKSWPTYYLKRHQPEVRITRR